LKGIPYSPCPKIRRKVRKDRMQRKNLWTIAIVTMAIGVVILFPACGTEEGRVYSQSVNITTERVDGQGNLAIIESFRDDELVNSMHFIDGDGDAVIDGKSGPKEPGQWPNGWGWFDDLYDDITVGESKIWVTDGKIEIQNGSVHEFRTGEYQCEKISLTE